MNGNFHLPLEARKSSSAGAEDASPPLAPGYELLRRIGRGSYGEVWLALDRSGIFRAVKVVYRHTFEHDRPFERELSGIQKFEPVSRTHASQVSILAVGRNEAAGYFYYVMELADDAAQDVSEKGREFSDGSMALENPAQLLASVANYVPKTLKRELGEQGPLPFRECLEIGLSLCKALEHLHQHGLIHRDIKPSNVIFVKGVPKLADIGLVTDVGATISHVGTEGFLPPEGPISPQADIYGLGKVLYEISTGRDRLDFPELPTFLDETQQKQGLYELNLVFLKACQTDPSKRYQSAQEMHADLALLQSGRSLRRARAIEQRLANVTRLALAAGAITLLAGSSYYFVNQHRLKKLQDEVNNREKEKRIVEKVAVEKSQQLANVYLTKGQEMETRSDLFGALLCYSEALGHDPSPDNKQRCSRQLARLLSLCPKMPAIFINSGKINSAALSPDGLRLVIAADDQTAQILDVRTGERIGPPLKHAAAVNDAVFSPDGQRIVTASADGNGQVWNAFTGEPVGHPLKHGQQMLRASFSPDGRQVLTLSDEPSACVWEASSGRQRFKLVHRERVLDAVFSSDGRYLATASADQTAQIWNLVNGEKISEPLQHDGPVSHLAFSPDSRRLVTASRGKAQLWTIPSGARAQVLLTHDGPINSLAFSPDGGQILSASEDQTLRVWDPVTGKLLLGPMRHPGAPRLACFSPDGRQILSVSTNEGRLWNAQTGELLAPAFTLDSVVTQGRFDRDGDRIVLVASSQVVQIVETFPRPSESLQRDAAENRPAQAWLSLAQLLSRRHIDLDQRMQSLKPSELKTLWQGLRKSSLEEFAPSDLASWHKQQAEQSEQQRYWFGAVFHWARLLDLQPKDPMARQKLDRTMLELAKAETEKSQRPEAARRIPDRSPAAQATSIDLSPYYNAGLRETWLPNNLISSGNDLSALSAGVQKLAGVDFDARGIVQLSGSALEEAGARFPRQVKVRINQKARCLHFLDGAAWDTLFGTVIGRYQVNYSNGETREIKLVFGQNIRDWWFFPTQHQTTSGATVAWQGTNPASQSLGMAVRLYHIKWTNPLPDVEIASVDFISSMEKPAPFLVALTVEQGGQ